MTRTIANPRVVFMNGKTIKCSSELHGDVWFGRRGKLGAFLAHKNGKTYEVELDVIERAIEKHDDVTTIDRDDAPF